MRLKITVNCETPTNLLAPMGLATPHLAPAAFHVEGGTMAGVCERQTGQWAALLQPSAEKMILTTEFRADGPAYPDAMFAHRPNRYTRAAEALAVSARGTAAQAGGGLAGVAAIVNDVCAQFTYGHPDTRFYEDTHEMPQLCGLTEGSCVDINAYLIAALRAAGYQAGYVVGYFFPEEKGGTCNDMHCWVVTRLDGLTLEWDIAHHLKMGMRDIQPGLNPKPGTRVPVFHSMGLDFPDQNLKEIKLLSEPIWLRDTGPEWADIHIGLQQ